MNNVQFAELLSDEDETALQYLENVTVEEYEDVRSGCTITMVTNSIGYDCMVCTLGDILVK